MCSCHENLLWHHNLFYTGFVEPFCIGWVTTTSGLKDKNNDSTPAHASPLTWGRNIYPGLTSAAAWICFQSPRWRCLCSASATRCYAPPWTAGRWGGGPHASPVMTRCYDSGGRGVCGRGRWWTANTSTTVTHRGGEVCGREGRGGAEGWQTPPPPQTQGREHNWGQEHFTTMTSQGGEGS